MKLKQIHKKGQVGQLPAFFQIVMLVAIMAGLTFIVADKFGLSIIAASSADNNSTAFKAVNETTRNLYDYGIGFIGIIILVFMVYLIISIVSGRRSGAK